MYQTDGWPATSAPDPSKYIFFSVTPRANYQIQFTSFDIDLWQSGCPDCARAFALRWDLDGFGSDLFSSRLSDTLYKTSYSFDLGSLAPRSDASEFRLYFYDMALDAQNLAVIAMGSAGDGMALHGQVVPEPSALTFILFLLALPLLTWARPHKRRLGISVFVQSK